MILAICQWALIAAMAVVYGWLILTLTPVRKLLRRRRARYLPGTSPLALWARYHGLR